MPDFRAHFLVTAEDLHMARLRVFVGLMTTLGLRVWMAFSACGSLALPAMAQVKPALTGGQSRIEPGLEQAVNWKWRVVPSEPSAWGIPLPETVSPTSSQSAGATSVESAPQARPATYEVKKGDALIRIGKKFGMAAWQLKAFNGLASDTIQPGQVLKIPTLEELRHIVPPPQAVPETAPVKAEPVDTPGASQASGMRRDLDDLLLQVFLDREQFSCGPIDGKPGPTMAKMMQLYQMTHEDVKDADALLRKARESVGDPLTHYVLRAEDFRFIMPLGGQARGGRSVPQARSRTSGLKNTTSADAPTYKELVAARALVYRTPWEFVAERFHCDETFLRDTNSRLKGTPEAGAAFLVPNVNPFEVERALEGPLQPPADPQKPVTAAVVELSRLEIHHDGKLVAAMPLGFARPDLRGRGSWTILDAIARPRLATLQEPKADAQTAPAPGAPATPAPPAPSRLAQEQYLAAGPNNPVGVVWMNLAKAKSTEPLPYGLHGTSIPSRMKSQEGIGGIRLTNWDIVRAARFLPAGTPLQWK